MPPAFDQYCLAAGLGGLVGACELISRYRDSPRGSISDAGALVYIGVNALASAVTLWLAILLQIDFKATPDSAPWIRALASGFGAMAILRSSFFSRQSGGADARIGPGNLLQTILDSADRAVDRARAQRRAREARQLADGVVFEKAALALPAYCFTLMQNLTQSDQTAIADSIQKLGQSPIHDDIKTQMLMTYLSTAVGYAALEAAKKALADKLR
jgi:hypothetical protein